MFLKSKGFQLGLAFALGLVVLILPRPEGTKFKVTGDPGQLLLRHVSEHFDQVSAGRDSAKEYTLKAKTPGKKTSTAGLHPLVET